MKSEIAIPDQHAVAFRRAVGDVWRQLGLRGYSFDIEKFHPSDGITMFAVHGPGLDGGGAVVIMLDMFGDLQITFAGDEERIVRNEFQRIFHEAGFTDSAEDHIEQLCLLLNYPQSPPPVS